MSYRQGNVLFCFVSLFLKSTGTWTNSPPRGRQPYLPHSLPLWPHHHIQQFKVRKASQRELKWNCFRASTTPSREAWLYDRPDDRRCDVVDNSRAFQHEKTLRNHFFFFFCYLSSSSFSPKTKKIRENKMSWILFFFFKGKSRDERFFCCCLCVALQGRSSKEGVGSINKKECFFQVDIEPKVCICIQSVWRKKKKNPPSSSSNRK